MKKFFKILFNIIYYLIIIGLIVTIVIVYKTRYYNDYTKTMKEKLTSFTREVDMPEELKNTGYKARCYKIINKDYNNALFFKEIEVEKNTPYRVSCYIKTNNVENKIMDEYKDVGIKYKGGANICLYGEDDRSKVIDGTQDWQKVEFEFNSKNNDKVNIAFRLGTDTVDSKGEAYFTDIRLEKGTVKDSSEWKFGMFVFKNIDVVLDNGTEIKEEMNDSDINLIKEDIDRFDTSIYTMTVGKIVPKTKTIFIDSVVKNISYDEENGYYLDIYDVYDLIKERIDNYDYDHVFFIFKSDDINNGTSNKLAESDWVGLGGMKYNEIGYSNIRLPKTFEIGRHMFIYNATTNIFPEEVYIHEFLHTLERNSDEAGLEHPLIHNYEDYGYENKGARKLKKYYTDFLNKNIRIIVTNDHKDEKKYIGLDESVYSTGNPVTKEDFEKTEIIPFDAEPKTFKEGVSLFIRTTKTNIGNIIDNIKNNNSEDKMNEIDSNKIVVNSVSE